MREGERRLTVISPSEVLGMHHFPPFFISLPTHRQLAGPLTILLTLLLQSDPDPALLSLSSSLCGSRWCRNVPCIMNRVGKVRMTFLSTLFDERSQLDDETDWWERVGAGRG